MPLFSIGHSTKPLAQLQAELAHFAIAYVLDVRSRPYSRYNPQYRKRALQETLTAAGFTYAFVGHQLGGKPGDDACYTNGKVDYSKIAQQPFFREGLERLLAAERQGQRVALMCAEAKPEQCHRSLLIGEALREAGVPLAHITGPGQANDQLRVIERARGQPGAASLWG